MNYKKSKNIYKRVLPGSVRRTMEPMMRNLLALQYKGDNVTCPVCERSFKYFIPLDNASGDHVCPKCGSIERHRLLWLHLEQILTSEMLADQPQVLHFSPNRFFAKRLKKKVGKNYKTTDYETKSEDLQLDITSMDIPDSSQDIIICYHVLEHIPDDKKAMSELYRILKPGGILLSQVPHREQATYENPEITTPEGRLEHFGQEDHVRWYGREDFIERLESAGFHVSELLPGSAMEIDQVKKFCIRTDEIIFSCVK